MVRTYQRKQLQPSYDSKLLKIQVDKYKNQISMDLNSEGAGNDNPYI